MQPNVIGATAGTIANQLGENDQDARRRMGHMVRVIGVERAQRIAQEAQTLHKMSTERTLDGYLKTASGIFFRLVREQASDEEKHALTHRPKQHRRR